MQCWSSSSWIERQRRQFAAWSIKLQNWPLSTRHVRFEDLILTWWSWSWNVSANRARFLLLVWVFLGTSSSTSCQWLSRASIQNGLEEKSISNCTRLSMAACCAGGRNKRRTWCFPSSWSLSFCLVDFRSCFVNFLMWTITSSVSWGFDVSWSMPYRIFLRAFLKDNVPGTDSAISSRRG